MMNEEADFDTFLTTKNHYSDEEIDSADFDKIHKTTKSINNVSEKLLNHVLIPESIKSSNPKTSADLLSDYTDFAKRAIDSLLRKLKDRPESINNFVKTITSKGDLQLGCIVINRTLDGRLQIAGKKVIPHAIYAKYLIHFIFILFRWPDLNKNDLKPLPICQFSFDLKLINVCINPYHYDKINNCSTFHHVSTITTTNQHTRLIIDMDHKSRTDNSSFFNPIIKKQTFIDNSTISPDSIDSQHFNILENNNFINTNTFIPEIIDNSNISIIPPLPQQPQLPITNFTLDDYSNNFISQTSSDFTEDWCTVTYYEFDVKVGEPLIVSHFTNFFIVDGYFSPESSPECLRMSLGQYTNIHRKDQTIRTLMYIGKGIQVDLLNKNDVFLKCLSSNSVFIESYCLDDVACKPHDLVIHKAYPGAHLKIFDISESLKSMQSFLFTQISQNISQYNSNTNQFKRFLTNTLSKFCSVKLSFVKGWGSDYPRKNIHETPCWIEISFTQSLIMRNKLIESL